MDKRLIFTVLLAVILGCLLDLADDGFPSRGAPDFAAAAAWPADLELRRTAPGHLPLARQPGVSAAPAEGVPALVFTPVRC